MNRSIALFVALAILLAHVLAIHNDGSGSLAFPYDQAHAAYRLARNLVVEGQLQWNPGSTAFESYSSPVWIAVCTIGERLCATRLRGPRVASPRPLDLPSADEGHAELSPGAPPLLPRRLGRATMAPLTE